MRPLEFLQKRIVQPPSPEVQVTPKRWNPIQRIVFRFVFVFFVLSIFPFPLGVIEGTNKLSQPYHKLVERVVVSVGKGVLGLGDEIQPVSKHSSDKIFDYVRLLTIVALSLFATVAWSIADRRRGSYNTLLGWLRLYVRYFLAFIMLGYGTAKVFRTQFPALTPGQLFVPFGESSPMEVLWKFMGSSGPYTVFSGLAELVGGALLFFRRTTTLGALVLLAVLTNIVTLNFCYDVPVKLFSSSLLLMSVFLISPDLGRLASVLVLNRPTSAATLRIPFRRPALEHARRGLKLLFIAWAMFHWASVRVEDWKQMVDARTPRVALYGYYDVREFVRNEQTVPAEYTQPKRWRIVAIYNDSRFGVRMMDSSVFLYKMEHDSTAKSLKLSAGGKEYVLSVDQLSQDELQLAGTLEADSIKARLRKIDTSKMPLVTRGFRWIDQAPINR